MNGAYYNERDPEKASWLRQLIRDGRITDGEVDERDVRDVDAADVKGFERVHWFAGIGGWDAALTLAKWEGQVWTGSCPCRPFSSAARGQHVDPDLWPEFRRLIAAGRPRVVAGEQVAQSGEWIDVVCADLEAMDYEVGATILPAVAVGLDHARPRIYFAGHTNSYSKPVSAINEKVAGVSRNHSDAGRVVPANGISARMVAFAGFGDAVIPSLASEFMGAFREAIR
jgi:DNA (cytosine-5)-methyltransferase 1